MILGVRTFADEMMKVSMVHSKSRVHQFAPARFYGPIWESDSTRSECATIPRHRGRRRPCRPRDGLLSATGRRPRHHRRSGGRPGAGNELCERGAPARELGGTLELAGSPLADLEVDRAGAGTDAAASPGRSRAAFVGTQVHSQFDAPSV